MSGGTSAVGSCPPALGRYPGESADIVPGAGTAFHHWPLTSMLPLGSLSSAVPCARLHARQILYEWNLKHLADDAEMVVSELATNALKASWSLKNPPPIALFLLADHEHLMIQIWDALSAPPDPSRHKIDAESGRGLEIVSMLSDRWGFFHPDCGGKVMWAVIEISRR
jgi:anti-sigma regulatory factor (Ser/Thr protein kinase)